MRRRSDPQLITQWQNHLKDRQESGLTVASWCRQKNIKPHQFWYWQKRLGGNPSRDRTTGFVPVKLKETSTPVRLRFANGTVLECTESTDPAWIGKIMAAMNGGPRDEKL